MIDFDTFNALADFSASGGNGTEADFATLDEAKPLFVAPNFPASAVPLLAPPVDNDLPLKHKEKVSIGESLNDDDRLSKVVRLIILKGSLWAPMKALLKDRWAPKFPTSVLRHACEDTFLAETFLQCLIVIAADANIARVGRRRSGWGQLWR